MQVWETAKVYNVHIQLLMSWEVTVYVWKGNTLFDKSLDANLVNFCVVCSVRELVCQREDLPYSVRIFQSPECVRALVCQNWAKLQSVRASLCQNHELPYTVIEQLLL